MRYTPKLSQRALGKLGGFPADALGELVRLMSRVCEDPYDVLHSVPVGDDPADRWAAFGEAGLVELTVDESAMTVTVEDLAWAG